MNASRKRPTISQVAAAAGVNRSSVSRAFSHPEMLSAETVERIRQAATELGYTPSQVAQALSTGKHSNIALIVPDVANPFFPPLIRAVQQQVDSANLCVFLGNSDEEPEQEDKLLARFSRQVEGIVLASSRLATDCIKQYARHIPLVLVNREVPGIARVLIDSGSGVEQAAKHLADLGHRTIAYLSGPTTSWANRQRRSALTKTARSLGIAVSTVPTEKPTFDAGRESVPALLETGATAAICFDDLMAQGVMAGLAERSVSVPAEFSVVGCDDVLGAATYPALTTVSNRSWEAGKTSASLLMEIMEKNSIRDARYVLETRLVIRDTTAPPAGPA